MSNPWYQPVEISPVHSGEKDPMRPPAVPRTKSRDRQGRVKYHLNGQPLDRREMWLHPFGAFSMKVTRRPESWKLSRKTQWREND